MKRYSAYDFPPSLTNILISAGQKSILTKHGMFSWFSYKNFSDHPRYYDQTLNVWRSLLEESGMWEEAKGEFMAFVLSGGNGV